MSKIIERFKEFVSGDLQDINCRDFACKECEEFLDAPKDGCPFDDSMKLSRSELMSLVKSAIARATPPEPTDMEMVADMLEVPWFESLKQWINSTKASPAIIGKNGYSIPGYETLFWLNKAKTALITDWLLDRLAATGHGYRIETYRENEVRVSVWNMKQPPYYSGDAIRVDPKEAVIEAVQAAARKAWEVKHDKQYSVCRPKETENSGC